MIHDELELSRELVLKVSGQEKLLGRDPLNQRSIEMREGMILPLLVIQQYALSQIKECKDENKKNTFEKLLLKTLAPVTNASRNSC